MPRPDTAAAEPEFSFGQMTPTADMWLYEQEVKRYSEPKAAVRPSRRIRSRSAAGSAGGATLVRLLGLAPHGQHHALYGDVFADVDVQFAVRRAVGAVNPATIMVPVAPVRSTTGYGLW